MKQMPLLWETIGGAFVFCSLQRKKFLKRNTKTVIIGIWLVTAITLQLYDQLEGELKDSARRNVAYLTVAAQLIDSSSSAQEIVSNKVTSELTKIEL